MSSTLRGREHAAGVLHAEIGKAVHSHGGLVLVTGEAGIGKTSLVTVAAEQARDAGVLVLSGSCFDAAGAPGFWPWVQVLRALRRAEGQLWSQLDTGVRDKLETLLGEAAGAASDEEFLLYDAVTTALVGAAQQQPVLVVVDDLHFADPASVRLLEFVAQHTWFERLLLVGTYRDVEVESETHPLRDAIALLTVKATSVGLPGLDSSDVGALIAHTSGTEPDADLVAEVHRRTGGNPFFVEQTARLWSGGGSLTAVPPGVSAAVQRRIELLPPAVADLLTSAAVLGRQFSRKVLASMLATPVARVDHLLDKAVLARLVVACGDGQFAFTHDLVRETLYGTLTEDAVRRRHAAVLAAVDASPSLGSSLLPAELARHAYLGVDVTDVERVIEVLLAAATDAGYRLSSDEALDHYRRAYEVSAKASVRTRVICTLYYAEHLNFAQQVSTAVPLFAEAAQLARDAADGELLARVALSMSHVAPTAPRHADRGQLLAEAMTVLTGVATPVPSDGVATAELAQRVAVEYAKLAKADGDDANLLFGLWANHNAIIGSARAAERAALTDELAAVARRSADVETELYASSFKWVALLEQGDPRYLDQFRTFITMADRSTRPGVRLAALADSTIIAGLHGAVDEAAAMLEALRAVEPDNPEDHPFAFMTVHLEWSLHLQRGAYDDAIRMLRMDSRGHPSISVLEAVTAAERGDVDALPALLQQVEHGQHADELEPQLQRLRAQAAAVLGDSERCERARQELMPLRGHWLVAMYGCDVCGPADLWLGILDTAQERWDSAITLLSDAEDSAERLGARPWVLSARLRKALALQQRAADGDAALAEQLLCSVASEAEGIGMRHLVDHVTHELGAVGVVARPPEAEFRSDGSVWTLRFAGHTAHLPDSKGLRDLHLLLGMPGQDVAVTRLLNPDGGEVAAVASSMGGDDLLDDEAKARYRTHLSTLDDEIERATELGDDDKAAELDRERAALLAELKAAAGLAGRSRRLGDAAERARKTVTARIKDTLRKLDQQHPALAQHLRASVTTGATCRYQPEVAVTWRR